MEYEENFDYIYNRLIFIKQYELSIEDIEFTFKYLIKMLCEQPGSKLHVYGDTEVESYNGSGYAECQVETDQFQLTKENILKSYNSIRQLVIKVEYEDCYCDIKLREELLSIEAKIYNVRFTLFRFDHNISMFNLLNIVYKWVDNLSDTEKCCLALNGVI